MHASRYGESNVRIREIVGRERLLGEPSQFFVLVAGIEAQNVTTASQAVEVTVPFERFPAVRAERLEGSVTVLEPPVIN